MPTFGRKSSYVRTSTVKKSPSVGRFFVNTYLKIIKKENFMSISYGPISDLDFRVLKVECVINVTVLVTVKG